MSDDHEFEDSPVTQRMAMQPMKLPPDTLVAKAARAYLDARTLVRVRRDEFADAMERTGTVWPQPAYRRLDDAVDGEERAAAALYEAVAMADAGS